MSKTTVRGILKAARKTIRDLGGKELALRDGHHFVFTVQLDGRIGIATAPKSPSDWRWLRNFRTQLKRIPRRGHPCGK